MVQSHNILEKVEIYLDVEQPKEELKDSFVSFIEGVKEFRNIWKDKETS